jgi:hypothetical protein
MIESFFNKLLADAFPGVEPYRFVWGPALSPLRYELLGLRRNHARDAILINDLLAEWFPGILFIGGYCPARPRRVIALEAKQERRERRIEQILAKLARDDRMKASILAQGAP